MQHPQYPYLLGNQMGALFALIWRIKGPLILWRHLGDITWFLEAWILKYIWSKLERGARMHHFWEDHQAVKNVMEREKTLEPTASFSLLHRFHICFITMAFRLFLPDKNAQVAWAWSSSCPDTDLVGLLPTDSSLHFSLGWAFPGVELPRRTAAYSLLTQALHPTIFQGTWFITLLLPRDSALAGTRIQGQISPFFIISVIFLNTGKRKTLL